MFLLPFPLLSNLLPLGFYKANLHSALYWPDSCPVQTTVNQNKLHVESMKSHHLCAETGRDWNQDAYLSICWDRKKKTLPSEKEFHPNNINLMVISPSRDVSALQRLPAQFITYTPVLPGSAGHQGSEPEKHLNRCLVWHWKSQWGQCLQPFSFLRLLQGYMLLFVLICFLLCPSSWAIPNPEIFSLVCPSVLRSA